MSIPMSRGLTLHGAALDGRALLGTAVALCLSVTGTLAGPCTVQITELEQRISSAPASPPNMPSAPQSVGAQLHCQPTPNTVQSAAGSANADADAALSARVKLIPKTIPTPAMRRSVRKGAFPAN